MELLEESSRLHRMVWACIAVAWTYVALFGLAALAAAIRW